MKKTTGLVEQHIHGAFGFDFMTCSIEELLQTARLLAQNGVCAFFPTIMTDDLNKIKERIQVVKEAQRTQEKDSAQIVGVHLEGPFISPNKAGIHDKKYILPLDIDLYKQIDDEIIKIVTIAPEFDDNKKFINYLLSKDVKVALGHSESCDFYGVNQVTHLYNAMTPFSHRGESNVVHSLLNNDIYAEIIADSMHVSDDVLKITFKQKPLDKILLISDALPLAHSDKKSCLFAGQEIYNENGKLVNKDGVFAGSSKLLVDIVKNLVDKNIMKFEDAIKCASLNQLEYHKITNNLTVYWNDLNEITEIEFN